MKASETNIRAIVEGSKQYAVPLFQRPYSWEGKEWKVLWEDLLELIEDEHHRNHFMGSIVTIPADSAPQGVSTFLLIDGQQRLTTLLLVLAALRDAALGSQPELAGEIGDTLLRNQYKRGNDAHKLIPTQGDRAAFHAVLAGQPAGEHRIGQAHAFFFKKIRLLGDDRREHLFHALLARLSLVSITLDRDDNPHLIFESLNAKGRALTQGDLIRNYFLMKVPHADQDSLYLDFWKPMEDKLGDNVTEFIRHFLTRAGKVVKQGDVYVAFKEQFDADPTSDVRSYLERLSTFAGYYERLLDPGKEMRAGLRRELERLDQLRVTVAYPFLLNIFDELERGRLSEPDAVQAIAMVVNLIVRRFVCGVSRAGLNKEFPVLFQQIERQRAETGRSFIDAARIVLASKGLPSDQELHESLGTARLYGQGDRADTTRLILEEIERSFGDRERVDFSRLTVEHIMPQTLTDAWRSMLGPEADAIHADWLHTLGNLTLSGYNSELSNAPFEAKRAKLASSNLRVNRDIAESMRWDEAAIRDRAERLALRVSTIWPDFGPPRLTRTVARADEMTGRTPVAIEFFGARIAVKTWRDVAEQTLEAIIERDDDAFADVVDQVSRYVGYDPSAFRSSRMLSNGAYVETHLSSNAIYRLCLRAVRAVDSGADAWKLVTAAG